MGNQNSQTGYSRAPDSNDTYPGIARQAPVSSQQRLSYSSAGAAGASRSSAPPAYSSDPAAAAAEIARAERAAALEAKMQKKRPQKKDAAAVKAENWKKYNEIGAKQTAEEEAQAQAAAQRASVGYRLADSQPVRPSPSTSSPAGSSSSSNSASSYVLTGQKHWESPQEAAIRAQRAAVFMKAAGQKKAKEAATRQERWKAYREMEKQTESKQGSSNAVIVNAPLPFGFPQEGGGAIAEPPQRSPEEMYPTLASHYPNTHLAPPPPPHTSAASSSSSSSSAASFSSPAPAPASPLSPAVASFLDQMDALSDKVAQMPPQSVTLIRKILANLLKSASLPEADGAKFRKLKLSNPKLQEQIVMVDGAVELLLTVGFEHMELPTVEGLESYLVFPPNEDMDVAQFALEQLSAFDTQGAQ